MDASEETLLMKLLPEALREPLMLLAEREGKAIGVVVADAITRHLARHGHHRGMHHGRHHGR